LLHSFGLQTRDRQTVQLHARLTRIHSRSVEFRLAAVSCRKFRMLRAEKRNSADAVCASNPFSALDAETPLELQKTG
jgi:hypothetical protein